MSATGRTLPLSTKLSYGIGSTAEGINAILFSSFTLYFYNQVLGISGSLTGLAIGIAIFFDAVSDPVAGYVSDRTVSRWGRRHPFMFGGALPFGLTVVAVFHPPAGMSDLFYFLWLAVVAILGRLFLTLFIIPHLALGAEIAHDYIDRTRIFAFSTLFAGVGGVGFAAFALTVFLQSGDDVAHGMLRRSGYGPMSLTAGAVAVACMLVCVAGTFKEVPHIRQFDSRNRSSSPGIGELLRELRSVFRNRSFRAIFFGLILGTLVFGIQEVFNVYVSIHFWGLSAEQIRLLISGVVLGIPFSFFLAPVMSRVFDKRNALIISAAVTIVATNVLVCLRLFTDVLPENGNPWIFRLVFLQSLSFGIVGPVIAITINSMYADIADEQEMDVGHRQEGVIFAARSFSQKAVHGLGAMIGGLGLDLIHFPRQAVPGEVPPSTVFNLGLIAGPLTSIFTFTGLVLYLGHRLDRRRLDEIKAALEARASPSDDALV